MDALAALLREYGTPLEYSRIGLRVIEHEPFIGDDACRYTLWGMPLGVPAVFGFAFPRWVTLSGEGRKRIASAILDKMEDWERVQEFRP